MKRLLTAAKRIALLNRTWPVYGPFPDPPWPGTLMGWGDGPWGDEPWGSA